MAKNTNQRTIRIALIDDHPVLLAGMKAILEQAPDIRVVGMIETLLHLGVAGYLRKTTMPKRTVSAVRDVAAGRLVLAAGPGSAAAVTDVEALTDRQYEVLKLVVAGFRNAEIARALQIGRKAVESHITQLFAKFRVRSRPELILKALRHGFVSLEDQERLRSTGFPRE